MLPFKKINMFKFRFFFKESFYFFATHTKFDVAYRYIWFKCESHILYFLLRNYNM